MNVKTIITTCLLFVLPLCASAQTSSAKDAVLLDMAQAFKKSDKKTIAKLLPQAKGHALEPWAAYWDMRLRLSEALPAEIDAFFKRYPNTYAEDRLRADWLLHLGQKREWTLFSAHLPQYRMGDDKDIQCYARYVAFGNEKEVAVQVEQLWMSQREVLSPCGFVARILIESGKMNPIVAWRKEYNAKTKFQPHWSEAQKNWAYGFEGRVLAQKLDLDALDAFGKVSSAADLSDDMLAWWVRAALRKQDWPLVERIIGAMSPAAGKDSTWVYWLAMAKNGTPAATALLESIAFENTKNAGFYEQLATEFLGRKINPKTMPQPAPVNDLELSSIKENKGLQRALLAIQIGLRAEGVREWNYEVNLASRTNNGSMGDRERLAAATWACSEQVWDRCINTSERTKQEVDWSQRFPTPFREEVLKTAKTVGVDAAYVYGLVRQESRFVMDARSHVGASGLMQVMPATARWTARKIGMTDYTRESLSDLSTNLTIGMSYLKLVLDDFEGITSLATAAYNAGPSRARNWREAMAGEASGLSGKGLDTAIWIENIPFAETRDYVKKVQANTNFYMAWMNQGNPSLKNRLGKMFSRSKTARQMDADLP
jgi:soluble lytic murein transglycosylase-like protein